MLLAITDEIRERSYENPNYFFEAVLEWGFILLVGYFAVQLIRGIVEDQAAGGPKRRREQRRVEEHEVAARRMERERRSNNPEPHEAKLDLVDRRIDVEHLNRTLSQAKKRWGSVGRLPAYIRNGLEYQEKKLPDTLRRIESLAQFVSQHESRHGTILATASISQQYLWACQHRGETAFALQRYRQQPSRISHDEWALEIEARKAHDRARAIREAFRIEDDFDPPFNAS